MHELDFGVQGPGNEATVYRIEAGDGKEVWVAPAATGTDTFTQIAENAAEARASYGETPGAPPAPASPTTSNS